MSHPNVHVTIDGHIGRIVLDRTHRKNACTHGMWIALGDAARRMGAEAPRVVVLTGAGGDFCAGADMAGDGEDLPPNQLVGMRQIGDSVAAIHDLPMPVIAAVDGVAVGAGFGLALAADLLVCSDRARFSLIFARRGLSLDYGTSYLLPQRIGIHHAKRLAFTGDIVDAADAQALGFVNDMVPGDDLAATTDALAAQVAAGPPLALSMSKRLLDNAARSSFAAATEAESLAQNVNFSTEDTRAAMQAFATRSTPTYKGR